VQLFTQFRLYQPQGIHRIFRFRIAIGREWQELFHCGFIITAVAALSLAKYLEAVDNADSR
jgi:hypothetical protein